MTLPAVTGVVWTRNPDGTVTPSWATDTDPNVDDYSVVVDGKPAVIVTGTSLPPLPGNLPHSITVTPVANPPAASGATYVPPPTKIGPRLLFDRGGPPPVAYRQAGGFGGYVVNAGGLQGEVPMALLFPTSDCKLAANNALDLAMAELASWAKQYPALALECLKVRIAMGFHLPPWMMSLAGPPILITDPVSGHSGQVARFWVPNSPLWEAIDTCLMNLGAKYDGEAEIGEFLASRNTTAYNEPNIRQITSAADAAALRAAGYTEAENLACFAHDFAFLPTAFPLTRVGIAFNPEQVVGPTSVSVAEATTESLIRQWWGSTPHASVENNSLGVNTDGSLRQGLTADYGSMYALMGSKAGMPAATRFTAIQTATIDKVGDLPSTIKYAGQVVKADHLELCAGYQQHLTQAQCASLAAAYLAPNA